MGVLNSFYQQLFEMNTIVQSLNVSFKGAQRQLEWMEMFLVYNKSYQHQTIYDSYDVELGLQFIQNVKFENTSSTYSSTRQLEYNQKNEEEKQWVYQMFVAYNCDGFSTAHLTQYKINKIYQEITEEDDFGISTKDDRVYIDMRRSKGYTDKLEKLTRDSSHVNVMVTLKKAAEKKWDWELEGICRPNITLVYSLK